MIAQMAHIRAIKEASELIITTRAAIQIDAMHKQHAPSKRLNF